MAKFGSGKFGDGKFGGDVSIGLGLSDAEVNELEKQKCRPVIFVEIQFSSGVKRYCSFHRNVSVTGDGLGSGTLGTDALGGKTYVGAGGQLLGIGPIRQTADLEAQGITVDLSGIDTDLREIAQSPSDYKNAKTTVKLGFLDSDDNLVTDPPSTIWQGYVNQMPLTVDPEQGGTIKLKAEGPLSSIGRGDARYWTDEDQKEEYPEDDFFKNAGLMQQQTINLYGSEIFTNPEIRYLGGLAGKDNTPSWERQLLRSDDREDVKIETGSPKRGEQARNVIYGTARVRNPVTFASLSNGELHFIMPLADHKCEGLQSFHLSEDTIWEDGSITSSFDSSNWRVQFHDGDKDQQADSYLVTNADGYDESMRGRGVAYVAVSVAARIGVFRDGKKLKPEAVVQGKNDLYNPLTKTRGHTDNAGVIPRDYLMSDRYGPRVIGSKLGKDTWNRLIRLSDSEITTDGGGSEKRFTINGNFSTAKPRKEVLDQMLAQIGGYLVPAGGRLEVVGGVMDDFSLTDINEDDLTGPLEISHAPGKASDINAIRGRFQWSGDGHNMATYKLKDEDAIDRSGGNIRWGNLDLDFTTSDHQARRVASYRLQQQIFSMAGSWEADGRLMQAAAGSRVKATNNFLEVGSINWTDKELLITESEIRISPNGVSVKQKFRDTADSEFRFTVQEDKSNTQSQSTRTSQGQGGPRERYRQVVFDKVELSPNGEEGDRVAKNIEAKAGSEVLVEVIDSHNKNEQADSNITIDVYSKTSGTTIKESSSRYDASEQTYEVSDTSAEEIIFELRNDDTGSRKVGAGKVIYQVRT